MLLLTAESLKKSYTERRLIDGVSFSINSGEKIGVIGINGTGKSTLLKIIAGELPADEGSVTTVSGLRIGYLPQSPHFEEGCTVLAQAMKHASAFQHETAEYECRAMLGKLGLNDMEAPAALLSGGQQKRLAIASVLAAPCDLLILDEPTNHLDSDTIEWLEQRLAAFRGAVLMVTHDRYFLDRICNVIFELDGGKLYRYDNANYSRFLERKAERMLSEQAAARKQQALYRKELAWIMQGPKARGTKQRFRTERFEELQKNQVQQETNSLAMNTLSSRLGKTVIEAQDLSKSFGGRTLFSGFSYTLLRNDRIGIIGPNGCGKTTLMRILSGALPSDTGSLKVGQTVKIGWFTQNSAPLDPNRRVYDYIANIAPSVRTREGTLSAAQLLEQFLFTPELQQITIGRLSGGEQRRLYLLSVLMESPNILLLDEPTNDLDTQTLTILEDYLEHFDGAVIAVSHDRYFLDHIASFLFAFENGTIVPYVGGYSDYLLARTADEKQKTTKADEKEKKKAPRMHAQKLRFSYKEQREYETIDADIATLEEKITSTEAEIADTGSDYEKLQSLLAEKASLVQALAQKMDRWLYLNDLAERIAAENDGPT